MKCQERPQKEPKDLFEKQRRKTISGEPQKRVKMTFGGKAQQTSSRISGKGLTALCRPWPRAAKRATLQLALST